VRRRIAVGSLRSAISWICLATLATPTAAGAQSLPAYAPVNPIAAARSGLATQPWLEPGRKWHISLVTDYASLIEYTILDPQSFLLDAEVMRLQLAVARNVGHNAFVLAEGSFNGAYDGFLDGFLDWYHKLTGFRVAGRDERPRNKFAYDLNLSQSRHYDYRPSSGFLGDLRLGAGLRHSKHWQSTLSFTLPTGSSPAGYRKGKPSINATTTLRSEFGKRFVYEGTLGAGYTPTDGALSDLQHTTFLMLTQGIRARLIGVLHAYGNVIYHSAYYHDTGISELDNRELTVDLGGMLRFRRGPEWIFGLTEDLEPSGPAVDVGFRLGVRW